MARHETDREDLFAELSSFVPRWELRHRDGVETVHVAARKDGRLAIFFGPDCCYHFDAETRLLRAYLAGWLYRTQGSTLARLSRERDPHQTRLVRTDLSDDELEVFRREVTQRLRGFLRRMADQEWLTCRAVAEETHHLQPVLDRLETVVAGGLLLAPPYPTRRK